MILEFKNVLFLCRIICFESQRMKLQVYNPTSSRTTEAGRGEGDLCSPVSAVFLCFESCLCGFHALIIALWWPAWLQSWDRRWQLLRNSGSPPTTPPRLVIPAEREKKNISVSRLGDSSSICLTELQTSDFVPTKGKDIDSDGLVEKL